MMEQVSSANGSHTAYRLKDFVEYTLCSSEDHYHIQLLGCEVPTVLAGPILSDILLI